MNTILFSDVHLNVAEDGRARMTEFTKFLRHIDPARVNRVVVVGDLFDFWFEYKHVIFSGYFDVLRAFASLADSGVALHFVCGNHDFWAGRFLRDHIGFEIARNTVVLPFGNRKALLIHGDGIDPSDHGYRIYKRIAQAPPVVWAFRQLHPDWAMQLSQWVARGSRHLFMEKDPSKGSQVKPLRDYAMRQLAEGNADVVICGHSHNPIMESFPTPSGNGLYINTGDWLFHQSFVEWDGEYFYQRSFGGEASGEPVSAERAQCAVQK